jgi:AraC-like DNA-binding protein
MQTAPPGYRAMMAGNTTAALARARGLAMLAHAPTRYEERKMHEARCFLLEHAAEPVDLPALAKRLGYSYSRFRTLFKRETGLSPRQYQLEIRINRANDLLSCSDQTVSQIADRLGFCSVYYFSRMFRERTGRRPSDVRSRAAPPLTAAGEERRLRESQTRGGEPEPGAALAAHGLRDLVRASARAAFRDRHGDWGRDLALWAGRRYAGLRLRELRARVGDADYTAVAMAIRRLTPRARRDRSLLLAMRRVAKECEK